jgi:hypothetical protein
MRKDVPRKAIEVKPESVVGNPLMGPGVSETGLEFTHGMTPESRMEPFVLW